CCGGTPGTNRAAGTQPDDRASKKLVWLVGELPDCSWLQAAVPCDQQRRTDEDQSQAESAPDAKRTPMQLKAQDVSQRQPDEPVSNQVGEHRCAGIAGAAESTSGNRLQAIEELKCSSDQQQSCTHGHDLGIRREQARDQV